MPSINLHTTPHSSSAPPTTTNPLPTLVKTPSGLALLEIQGTVHAPFPTPSEDTTPTQTNIGRLEFPLYDPTSSSAEGTWMKKVYLYVGKHQRLPGEVKKLPKAMAVLRKRNYVVETEQEYRMRLARAAPRRGDSEDVNEDLEIAEIVRWKIIFAGRPEPVGGEEV
jgi:chromosome transmission fidelity protein 8